MPTRRPTPPRRPTRRPTVVNRRTTPARQPSMARVFAPSWGRPVRAPSAPPVAPAAPPASAVAPAAYSLANLPVDASYDQQVGALGQQRTNQLAAITGERVRTLSDYGFHEGPNGALAFDPNNPFSKAAVLKQTYETSRRSTGQSMGAGGQLYSGAYQNSQDLVNRNQLQSEDAQQKALAAFLARNTGQATDANTGYEMAVGQADADRVARFQSNPNYDPAASPDPAAAAAASAAGAAPAAARAAGTTKRDRGFLWQQNSNGTWRKIRPLNAWGN